MAVMDFFNWRLNFHTTKAGLKADYLCEDWSSTLFLLVQEHSIANMFIISLGIMLGAKVRLTKASSKGSLL
eukprot:1154246-Pelagomonas_calceolata.AAC.3